MRAEIAGIITEQFNIDATIISDDSSLEEDLDLDSNDIYELLTLVEDNFDLEFQEDSISNIKTVGDIIDYIVENRYGEI